MNFYLSSITVSDLIMNLQKTKPEIWNISILLTIKLEDSSDKEDKRIRVSFAWWNDLTKKIFEIYKQIPFNLNTLINAKNNYQTLMKSWKH